MPSWHAISKQSLARTSKGPGSAAIVAASIAGSTWRAMAMTPTVPPISIGSTPWIDHHAEAGGGGTAGVQRRHDRTQ